MSNAVCCVLFWRLDDPQSLICTHIKASSPRLKPYELYLEHKQDKSLSEQTLPSPNPCDIYVERQDCAHCGTASCNCSECVEIVEVVRRECFQDGIVSRS